MSKANEEFHRSKETEDTQMQAPQYDFGRNHKDLDEDFAALKSVLGFPAFSGQLKQLKNSFSVLKSLFTH